ncbi:hypothetical protein [Isoptericola sp. NPDC019482]|uniref:hypothetical protein n=1 Tax=Isoptericola sp. NPDC019482 TaxID=3154688 RepID=UPI00346C0D9B
MDIDGGTDDAPVRRRGVRRVVAALVVAALVLPAAALTLQAVPVDGARMADDLADEVADRLAADLNDVRDPSGAPLDATRLAAHVVDVAPSGPAADGVTYAVWPDGWSDDGGTTVDVSVRVDVAADPSTGMLGRARAAGSATSCWHFVVRPGRERADRDERDCAVEGEGQIIVTLGDPPPASSFGVYDDDAVAQALHRSGRDLVVAVGTPGTADCVVAVRPDGAPVWELSGIDPAAVEPGGPGCVPELYTARD